MSGIAQRTDQQLQDAVTDELRWTPSVNSAQIRVVVAGGTATLSGQVATYPETLLAARSALQVRGIVAVAQEITVRGPWAAATDTQIARHAGDALTMAPDVPDSVKASVHERTLTLSGQVASQHEAQAACRAVNYIPGLEMVVNEMTIGPET
ncbi:osmotically-inducible protein OsmY [Nakamurella sp. UYEF19]|uniref:BON domain-containing protein n=1 Tax=Nakamurella sp. UYEF19 TaxID=1756392 RepID=UPI003395ABD2